MKNWGDCREVTELAQRVNLQTFHEKIENEDFNQPLSDIKDKKTKSEGPTDGK